MHTYILFSFPPQFINLSFLLWFKVMMCELMERAQKRQILAALMRAAQSLQMILESKSVCKNLLYLCVLCVVVCGCRCGCGCVMRSWVGCVYECAVLLRHFWIKNRYVKNVPVLVSCLGSCPWGRGCCFGKKMCVHACMHVCLRVVAAWVVCILDM